MMIELYLKVYIIFYKNYNFLKNFLLGYCFFQFLNSKNTDKAIKGLNGLEVGDRKLKV